MKTIERRLTVGYARSAVKNDLSIKEQKKQIIEYCRKNCREVDKVFSDNGCSGANLNRPALQELLVEASKGKIFNVICLDTSRLSRNTSDYLALMSLFKKYEVEVTFLSGIFINKDSCSEFFDEILASVNALNPRIGACKRRLKKSGK